MCYTNQSVCKPMLRSGCLKSTRQTHKLLLKACLGFIFVVCIYSYYIYASPPSFKIIDAVWTSQIIDKNPTEVIESIHLDADLYFWINIKGDENTLKYIEKHHKLPLVIKYVFILGGTAVGSGSVDFFIEPAEILKIRKEFKLRGYFDWRTHSRKKNLIPGWLHAIIENLSGAPIRCEGGGMQDRCEYDIKVKNK